MTSKKIIIREYKAEDAEDLAKIYYNTIHNFNIQDYTPAIPAKSGNCWNMVFCLDIVMDLYIE